MAQSLAEFGGEKRCNQIPGQFRAFEAAAQANDVEMVVFDSLSGGKMIFNEARANAFDFIRANGCANAAAANGHPAIDGSSGNGLGQRNDEVGVIIIGIERVRAKVNNLVARRPQTRRQLFLQFKSTMICSHSQMHKFQVVEAFKI